MTGDSPAIDCVDTGGQPTAEPVQVLTASEIADEFWQEIARWHGDAAAFLAERARLMQPALSAAWGVADPLPLPALLNLDGSDFITAAYATLLDRVPDHAGIAYCTHALNSGDYSKVELLGQLQASDEARSKGRRLPGLRRRYYVRRLYRLPVVGAVLRALATGLRRIGFSRLLAPQGS